MDSCTDWLLIHGLGATAAYWRDFPARLAEATGARVHTLDLPGAGEADGCDAPLDLLRTVDDVRARWLGLRARSEGTWGVLGLSMGGMVAMDWCGRFGGDFARLVTVSTSTALLDWPWQRLTPRGTATVGRILLTGDPAERHRLIMGLTLNDPARRSAALEAPPSSGRGAVSRRTWARQLTAATRYRGPGRLEVPVLVVAAEGDRMVDPACSRRLARHLDAPLELHPSAGHDLAGDAPAWLAAAVSR